MINKKKYNLESVDTLNFESLKNINYVLTEFQKKNSCNGYKLHIDMRDYLIFHKPHEEIHRRLRYRYSTESAHKMNEPTKPDALPEIDIDTFSKIINDDTNEYTLDCLYKLETIAKTHKNLSIPDNINGKINISKSFFHDSYMKGLLRNNCTAGDAIDLTANYLSSNK